MVERVLDFSRNALRSREYCFPSPDFGDLDQLSCALRWTREETLRFFYRDGVRFAVERNGREVWVDWPED